MERDIRDDARLATERRRRPPGDTTRLVVTFGGGGEIDCKNTDGPIELRVEPTDRDGHLAEWLDDTWWTKLIERWGDDAVTITIAPTRDALLHPVVLHHLEMLQRVVPAWRIVGHAYLDDAGGEQAIRQLAMSPYHEVRFVDRLRPGTQPLDRCVGAPGIGALFAAVREEQARVGARRPVLVRMPLDSGAPPSGGAADTVGRRDVESATS